MNKASDLIESAISEAMKSNEDYDPNDILIDWVAIGYAANPERKDGAYPMFFTNGQMPNYRARGLLVEALMSNLGED